jgi:hypothetical protein
VLPELNTDSGLHWLQARADVLLAERHGIDNGGIS